MSDHAHSLVAHQFEQPEQQLESVAIGMWAFLVTEVLFFGGLFALYGIYRWQYPDVWYNASHLLERQWGMLNTGILLVSSLTMALGVHAASLNKQKQLVMYLVLTIILAFGFLGVKSVEYTNKYHHHLIPGMANFDPIHEIHEQVKSGKLKTAYLGPIEGHGEASIPGGKREVNNTAPPKDWPLGTSSQSIGTVDDEVRKYELFFSLYFCMTGLHGIHVIIGIGGLFTLLLLARKGWFHEHYYSPVEMVGLYWHFVDIVWVFLFPLLYLIT